MKVKLHSDSEILGPLERSRQFVSVSRVMTLKHGENRGYEIYVGLLVIRISIRHTCFST